MIHSISSTLIGALALLTSVSSTAFAQEAGLDLFFKNYLEEHFRQRPLEASRLGDHRFDHLLDDVSSAARAGRLAHTRKTLKDPPREGNSAKLSRDAQIDLELCKHSLQTQL